MNSKLLFWGFVLISLVSVFSYSDRPLIIITQDSNGSGVTEADVNFLINLFTWGSSDFNAVYLGGSSSAVTGVFEGSYIDVNSNLGDVLVSVNETDLTAKINSYGYMPWLCGSTPYGYWDLNFTGLSSGFKSTTYDGNFIIFRGVNQADPLKKFYTISKEGIYTEIYFTNDSGETRALANLLSVAEFDGNLWFSTYHDVSLEAQTVSYFDGNDIHFDVGNFGIVGEVTALTSTANYLYVATLDNNSIERFDGTTWSNFTSFADMKIKDITFLDTNIIVIGSQDTTEIIENCSEDANCTEISTEGTTATLSEITSCNGNLYLDLILDFHTLSIIKEYKDSTWTNYASLGSSSNTYKYLDCFDNDIFFSETAGKGIYRNGINLTSSELLIYNIGGVSLDNSVYTFEDTGVYTYLITNDTNGYCITPIVNELMNDFTYGSADFNSIYLNVGGNGSGDLNQVDANKWYWKQFDLNAQLQISDFNNVWISWKDGNATYIKITDTNNASRINYNAIADLNSAYYTQLDANTIFIKISDSNNTGRLQAKVIADWNTESSITYTSIANPPWLTTGDNLGSHIATQDLNLANYDLNSVNFISVQQGLNWLGDEDTNLSHATNELQLYAGGTKRIIANANGVGISTNPTGSYALETAGTIYAGADIYSNGAVHALKNNYFFQAGTETTRIEFDPEATNNFRLYHTDALGISIERHGLVGIGADSTGSYNLEVAGTTYSSTGITSGENITATKDLTVNGGDIITGVNTNLGNSNFDLNILLTDNNANALVIKQGTINYLRINTTNGSEQMTFGSLEPNNIRDFNFLDNRITSGHNIKNGTGSGYGACIGQDSTCNGFNTFALGDGLRSSGEQCLAINRNNICDADNSFVGGYGSDANYRGGNVNFSYGYYCTADGGNSVAMGNRSRAVADSSIALGHGAVADRPNLIALSNDVDINGFLTVGQGKDENRGLSIGDGNFSNNLYVQNTARIGKKLSINYNGTIDTGVQAHMKGDASNNANIRMDGFTSGFFYFGFNDLYEKAALSVSNGTNTTWDALDIDANGKVGIGMDATTPFTHRLEVDGNVYIQSNLKIDGNLMYSPDVNTRKNVHWIFPNDGRALNTSVTRLDYIDFDIGNQAEIECNTANPTLCLLTFPVSIDRLYGANNKITKIEVDMNKTSTLDNINKFYLYSYNRGTGAFDVDYYDATWRAGKNLTASYRTYSAYSNSTGITMDFNRQYTIQLDVNNAASGGVKIYGIKIEYITT